MNKFNIFLSFAVFTQLATAQTTYKLIWDSKKLPFEVKTAQATLAVKNRVSETGQFSEKLDLPIMKQMPEGAVTLNIAEDAYIYLFIKNTSKKKIRFSVAPHSTHPGSSALGFVFNCLCNGHIYTAEPDQIWYRIMQLKNNSTRSAKNIELMHYIFEIKK